MGEIKHSILKENYVKLGVERGNESQVAEERRAVEITLWIYEDWTALHLPEGPCDK